MAAVAAFSFGGARNVLAVLRSERAGHMNVATIGVDGGPAKGELSWQW
jgi:hypothetical protein